MTTIDLKKLFTSVYRDNLVWSEFSEAVTEVMSKIVDSPRIELQNTRRNREKESLTIPDINQLYNNARLLGFDFLRTLMSSEDYQRLVDSIALFRPKSGTKQFVNFIGFVKNSRFIIDQLWTEDYVNFFTDPQGTTILEGGTWYPTSHVELTYDYEKFEDLTIEEVHRLFYLLAPIYLVLERLDAKVIADDTLYVGAQALGESVYIYGVADEGSAESAFFSGSPIAGQYYESAVDTSVAAFEETNFTTGEGDNFVTGEGDNITTTTTT